MCDSQNSKLCLPSDCLRASYVSWSYGTHLDLKWGMILRFNWVLHVECRHFQVPERQSLTAWARQGSSCHLSEPLLEYPASAELVLDPATRSALASCASANDPFLESRRSTSGLRWVLWSLCTSRGDRSISLFCYAHNYRVGRGPWVMESPCCTWDTLKVWYGFFGDGLKRY
jgi:hypothetical protein